MKGGSFPGRIPTPMQTPTGSQSEHDVVARRRGVSVVELPSLKVRSRIAWGLQISSLNDKFIAIKRYI
jgi:hypothetical protein